MMWGGPSMLCVNRYLYFASLDLGLVLHGSHYKSPANIGFRRLWETMNKHHYANHWLELMQT